MKKILFLGIIAIMAVSCNKSVENKPETAKDGKAAEQKIDQNDISQCDAAIIAQMDHVSIQELPNWLRTNGSGICQQQLFQCLVHYHVVARTTFNAEIQAHEDNTTTTIEYPIVWSNIKSIINNRCYDTYVGFTINNTNHTMTPRTRTAFSTNDPCFSAPFLRGLEIKHNLTPGDILLFYKAREVTPGPNYRKLKYVFKFVDDVDADHDGQNDIYYYNISDNPKKKLL